MSVSNAEDKATLWGFIREVRRRTPRRRSTPCSIISSATRCSYYRDFVKPAKTYRLPTAPERKALEALVR